MEYCNGMMYAVKNGDTLYSISMKYNIPLALLLRANPYVDVYNLQAGETICLPVKEEQECGCRGEERCAWEGGENTEETGMENASGEGRSWREDRQMMERTEEESGRNTSSEEMSQRMEGSMEMEQTADRDGRDSDLDRLQWERYVTQPGDTLDIILGGSDAAARGDWEDILEDFVEKNDISRIYLLPGIVYYRRK